MEEDHSNKEVMEIESPRDTMTSVNEGKELVTKPDTKSQVWQYFGLKVQNGKLVDNEQSFCKICCQSVWETLQI